MDLTQVLRFFMLGIAVLIVVMLIAKWRNVRKAWFAIRRFLREVKVEMQKVSWPSRNDLIGSTIAVLTVVVVLTIIVTAADQMLSWIMHVLLPGGGA